MLVSVFSVFQPDYGFSQQAVQVSVLCLHVASELKEYSNGNVLYDSSSSDDEGSANIQVSGEPMKL
jgi:hypothetical protein